MRKKHGMPGASACVRQIMFQYVNGFKRNSLPQLQNPVDDKRHHPSRRPVSFLVTQPAQGAT